MQSVTVTTPVVPVPVPATSAPAASWIPAMTTPVSCNMLAASMQTVHNMLKDTSKRIDTVVGTMNMHKDGLKTAIEMINGHHVATRKALNSLILDHKKTKKRLEESDNLTTIAIRDQGAALKAVHDTSVADGDTLKKLLVDYTELNDRFTLFRALQNKNQHTSQKNTKKLNADISSLNAKVKAQEQVISDCKAQNARLEEHLAVVHSLHMQMMVHVENIEVELRRDPQQSVALPRRRRRESDDDDDEDSGEDLRDSKHYQRRSRVLPPVPLFDASSSNSSSSSMSTS